MHTALSTIPALPQGFDTQETMQLQHFCLSARQYTLTEDMVIGSNDAYAVGALSLYGCCFRTLYSYCCVFSLENPTASLYHHTLDASVAGLLTLSDGRN